MKNKPTVRTTGRYQLRYRGVKCLNCAHPLDLSDKYCPNCSQANSIKKLTINDFFAEFFNNIISYDSKLFQTLAALLLKPGRITKEYIQGKRLSYTNPFRFLLSLAIIYFLLMGLNGEYKNLDRYGTNSFIPKIDYDNELNNIEFDSEKEKQEVLSVLDSLKLKSVIDKRFNPKDSLILNNPKGYFDKIQEPSTTGRYLSKIQFYQTVIKKDSIYSFNDAIGKYNLPDNNENSFTFSVARSLTSIESRPGSFVNDFISKLPFATFFFLPLFSMFVWLLYIRKKYTYTEHLIFSFHNQSLLFILLILSYLVNAIFKINSEGFFILIFAIYLYKAMRNFYEQGRFKTILKYVFLNSIFIILAVITVVVLVAGSALTY